MSMLPARQVTFSATTVMVFPAGKLKSALPSRSFMSPLFSTALRLGETLPTSAATANAPLPLAVPAKAGLLTNSKPRRRSRAALISPSPCHQLSGMVPQAGLEPARSCEQQILSLRLVGLGMQSDFLLALAAPIFFRSSLTQSL